MSMSLTFYGDKYTAQSYEFTVTDNSDNHLVIKKRDVSSDGETGVVFDVDISAADLMDSMKPVSISASLELRLSGSDAILGIQVGDAVFRKMRRSPDMIRVTALILRGAGTVMEACISAVIQER